MRDVKEAETHKKLFYEMLKCKKIFHCSFCLNGIGYCLKRQRQTLQENKKASSSYLGKQVHASFSGRSVSSFKEFFSRYEKNKSKMHPVELAALVHLKFVTIHPFSDGNGRISRIMMNFVLHKRGYPMLDIPYTGRDSYYNALQRAQIKKADSVFVVWLIKKYI